MNEKILLFIWILSGIMGFSFLFYCYFLYLNELFNIKLEKEKEKENSMRKKFKKAVKKFKKQFKKFVKKVKKFFK
jgi:beta-lactamase regulating signal transducer with metallopeptidase domain